MEVKRQLDVLDRHLADREYFCADEYTIADISIWPWYGALVLYNIYDSAEFLDVKSYSNVVKWAERVGAREAVKRGRMVNRSFGPEDEQLRERHEAKLGS